MGLMEIAGTGGSGAGSALNIISSGYTMVNSIVHYAYGDVFLTLV